jgi:hypothetical protein
MRDKTAIQKKMRTLIKMTAEFCDIYLDEICSYFKTNKITTYQKSKRIRDMLNIKYRDKEFSTPYIIENDPLSHLRIPEELATQLRKLMKELEKKSILELSKNVKTIHKPKKRKSKSNSKSNGKDNETLKQLKLSDFKEEHETI